MALLAESVGRRTAPLAHALDAVPGARVVIVPALSPPAFASVALVEALVDLLLAAGAEQVSVAAAVTTADRDRGHTGVQVMAAAAGYRGRTLAGRSYEVLDLRSGLVPAPVDPASVLAGAELAAAWLDAQVRVVVARSATDAAQGYAGCLEVLLGVAAELPGAEPADVAADLLACAPPTLALVDAVVSSHGPDGRHVLRELATDALVAATDALLADVLLADLQGEDRAASRLVQRGLERWSQPAGEVVGDLTPFSGWVRAHPLLRDGIRRAAATPQLGRLLAAACGGPDPGAGPVDPLLAGLRTLLTPLVAASDDPAARGTVVGMLAAAAALGQQVSGWTVTTAKHRVPRVVVPLGFDPADFSHPDYDALPALLAPLDGVLASLPQAPGTLRWRHLDGSVVFETSRVVAAAFADFVARVEVAEGISLMADYVGGRRVAISRDSAGRVVRQAERNVYLPQPNYLAYWGGAPIDVCKIELVERDATRYALHWRTIASPNGSASYDDGTLTFADAGAGRTRLSVRGRQLFSLPLYWQAVDLDRVPEVKDELVEDAYQRFFGAKFDNLVACYEGRPYRIGRPPAGGDEPLATRSVQMVWELVSNWLGDRSPRAGADGATGPELDVHGFRHFRGPGAAGVSA